MGDGSDVEEPAPLQEEAEEAVTANEASPPAEADIEVSEDPVGSDAAAPTDIDDAAPEEGGPPDLSALSKAEVAAFDEAAALEPPESADVEATSSGDAVAPDLVAWTEALRSVERSINEAAESIRLLRAMLQQLAPLLRSIGGLEEALGAFIEAPQHPEASPAVESRVPLQFPLASVEDDAAAAAGSRAVEGGGAGEWQATRRKPSLKERAQQPEETEERRAMTPGSPRTALKRVTLVPDDTPAPYAYRVTVEDRKNSVELMQLHAALASIAAVRNLSLLNYVNGIASISLESVDELQPVDIENALHKVMKRDSTVVPHESSTFLVQLRDRA